MSHATPDLPAAALHTPDLAAVRRLGALCAAVCLILAIALPAVTAGYWGLAADETIASRLDPAGTASGLHLSAGLLPWQRVLGALLSLLPVAALAAGLLDARRCLRIFATGAFFRPEAAVAMSGFARGMFLAALGGLLLPTVLSLALTAANPPGQRALIVAVSSDQVLGMLLAGILWVIAGTMAQAAVLAEEYAQVV